MSISVPQFITANNGEKLISPHGILGQCVSLPSLFAVQNGWPELYGAGDTTALNIWRNGVGGYTKILNVPSNAPVAGDFVFFNYAPDGHVVLVESANLTTIMAFEQNDGTGSPAHTKAYSYFDVLGWFHKPQNVPAPSGGVATVLHQTNVRAAPNTTAPVTSVLLAGNTFAYSGKVTGESITENGVTSNLWDHSNLGHFVWAGNCKG